MPSCIVKNCKNYLSRKGSAKRNRAEMRGNVKKVSYFSFPNDPIRRRKWARYLNIENVKDGHRVCSDHFHEDVIDRTALYSVRLRPNALPIYFEELFNTENDNSVKLSNKSSSNCSKSLEISQENPTASDTNECIRKFYEEKIELLKRNKKVLSQSLRQVEKKIALTGNILEKLKARIENNQLEDLIDIDESNDDLLQECQKVSHLVKPD